MRDIIDYGKEYLKASFEVYQVKYRRKMLLERIKYWTEKTGHPLNILEVGIGLEPLFQFVEVFNEWICIEPNPDFTEHAKTICNSKVTIIQGFLEECTEKIGNKHFDLIIISSLLHEVEEPESFLDLICKIADRESVIHINVPNADSMHRILAREAGLITSVKGLSERNLLFQQHTVFDLEMLLNMVRSLGDICIEEKGSYFIKPFTHEQMQKMLDQGIISEKVLDGLYNLGKRSREPFFENGSEIFVEFRIY